MVPAGLEAMRDALEALADADVIERAVFDSCSAAS